MVGTGFKYGGHQSSKVVGVMPEVVEGRVDIQGTYHNVRGNLFL